MMISRQITINNITYTVSATTLRGLEEAITYLRQSLKEEEYQGPEPAEAIAVVADDFSHEQETEDPEKSDEPKKAKPKRRKKDE